MISVPIAVHNNFFKWQLELFWWQHKRVYETPNAHAVIIKRNFNTETFKEFNWDIDIPFTLVDGVSDLEDNRNLLPLNIQLGLQAIVDKFDDNEVIEILDCDMFHLKQRNFDNIQHDILICDNVYEDWHLKSLSSNKKYIDLYFENNGQYYNGGFVPIICTIKTLKKILPEWIAVHKDIVKRDYNSDINWWAGMFALQAACEKKRVQMIAFNDCYIPPLNELKNHSIAHYSVDSEFANKKGNQRNISDKNLYTKIISEYVHSRSSQS